MVGLLEDVVLPPQLIMAATANDKTIESANAVYARALRILIFMVPPCLSVVSEHVEIQH